MGLVHERAEALEEGPLTALLGQSAELGSELRTREQLAKLAGTRVLVHGVRRRRAHAIARAGAHARDRIRDAGEALQEFSAADAFGQERPVASLELGRGEPRQVATPLGILDADVTCPLAGLHAQAAFLGDPAIAHERGDAHLRVVGAADLVPQPRVDAPEGEARGDGEARL
jgi:hypothetical protein